jgi:hypothetical protein
MCCISWCDDIGFGVRKHGRGRVVNPSMQLNFQWRTDFLTSHWCIYAHRHVAAIQKVGAYSPCCDDQYSMQFETFG